MIEIQLDCLLGREVMARGHRVGRIEEFRATVTDDTCEVTDYVIGAAGLFERLGVGLKLLVGVRGGGHVARWDQVDISDPEHPRLTCPLEELRALE